MIFCDVWILEAVARDHADDLGAIWETGGWVGCVGVLVEGLEKACDTGGGGWLDKDTFVGGEPELGCENVGV